MNDDVINNAVMSVIINYNKQLTVLITMKFLPIFVKSVIVNSLWIDMKKKNINPAIRAMYNICKIR